MDEKSFQINILAQEWLKTDIDSLKVVLKRNLPEDINIQLSVDNSRPNPPYFMIEIYNPDGLFSFSIHRDRKGELIAWHEDAGARQGSGVALKINQNFAQICHNANIAKSMATATRYAASLLSRRGFLPDPKDWIMVREKIRKRLEYIDKIYPGQIPAKLHEALTCALQSDDPAFHRFVASIEHRLDGHKLGKILTAEWEEAFFPNNPKFLKTHQQSLSVSWRGIKDLDDPESRRLHERYLQLPSQAQKSYQRMRQAIRFQVEGNSTTPEPI